MNAAVMTGRLVRLTITTQPGHIVIHLDGDRLLTLATDDALTLADELTIAAERRRTKDKA